MFGTRLFTSLMKRNMKSIPKYARVTLPVNPQTTHMVETAQDLEYVEKHSKHENFISLYDLEPSSNIGYTAPSASIVAEVIINSYATVWNNVVIKGDINAVFIGQYTSVGDNTVIQTVASLPTGLPSICSIGANVTINSDCTLSSCIVEKDVVIGAKSVICEGAKLEEGCMIAPGSVVPPGRLIPAKQLWGGNPVEYIKDLDIGELFTNYSLSYVHASLGQMVNDTYLTWPTGYLEKETTQEDLLYSKGEKPSEYFRVSRINS